MILTLAVIMALNSEAALSCTNSPCCPYILYYCHCDSSPSSPPALIAQTFQRVVPIHEYLTVVALCQLE
jgi:hypothetical protein